MFGTAVHPEGVVGFCGVPAPLLPSGVTTAPASSVPDAGGTTTVPIVPMTDPTL